MRSASMMVLYVRSWGSVGADIGGGCGGYTSITIVLVVTFHYALLPFSFPGVLLLLSLPNATMAAACTTRTLARAISTIIVKARPR